jgi:hypothetical protein
MYFGRLGHCEARQIELQFSHPSTMKTSEETKRSWLWLVLLIPYAALLWLPFYNDSQPSFAGFPFFYWYQFLWVPLTSLIIYIVYRGVK